MALQTANVPDSAHGDLEFHKLYGDDFRMHLAATQEQQRDFCRKHPQPFYCFGVPRQFPVADFDNPAEGLLSGEIGNLEQLILEGQPGEYLAFQIVVWSPVQALGNLHIQIDNFPLPVRIFLQEKNRRFNLSAGHLQVFWCMVDLPLEANRLDGRFSVVADGFSPVAIDCSILVNGEPVTDGGISNDQSLARLRWLDSDIGKDHGVLPPYLPLRREGNKLYCLGRTLTLSPCGLPEGAESFFTGSNERLTSEPSPILASPFCFQITCREQPENKLVNCQFVKETPEAIYWEGRKTLGKAELRITGRLEYDGFASYTCKLLCHEKCSWDDLSLVFSVFGEQFVGLNQHGCFLPKHLRWYWDPFRNQDSFWMGTLNSGLRIRLRDSNSRTPLTNCYYNFSKIIPPDAWDNHGLGGIEISSENDVGQVRIFTGPRTLESGAELHFDFELQLTPFKCTTPEKHLKQRFYHPHMHNLKKPLSKLFTPAFFADLRKDGVQVINLHHALQENPIINLPFTGVSLPYLQKFVALAHAKGLKVCLYYTIRELTLHAPEFWAMASLRGEIFFPGPGREARSATAPKGAHPYLLKNCRFPYLSAWAESIKEGPLAGELDLALETTPDSERLENYFLEGLRYLLERCPLDGLYLDDSSLTRKGFQRLWKVFRDIRGCDPIINLHTWNPYNDKSPYYGNGVPLLRDIGFYPFITSLWLGEAFDYERASPEYYLNEISGLPFGLMSEMLRNGGNPWRGMLFGMTGRYGWLADPRSLWKLFDLMDLPHCNMIGFYDKTPVVQCSVSTVRATLYVHHDGKRALLAAASWCDHEETVHFQINRQMLPENLCNFQSFHAIEMAGLQRESRYTSTDAISIAPGKGILLLLE